MQSEQEITNDIIAHVNRQGGPFALWYVGITSDTTSRLHVDHKVPEENHWFITRNAGTVQSARNIEALLIENYEMDGGPGGGDDDSIHVYAYLKTSVTDP